MFFLDFSQLLTLLLKATKVTTEYCKWPKMSQNSKQQQKSLGQRPKSYEELEFGRIGGHTFYSESLYYLIITLFVEQSNYIKVSSFIWLMTFI